MTMQEHDFGTEDIVAAGAPDDRGARADEVRVFDDDGTTGTQPDTQGDTSGTADTAENADAELFARDDRQTFENQWSDVQSRFVDDPRQAVASADHLVAEVMQSLAQRFSDHKTTLEGQWAEGGEADTEELRQAMQRYRAFFQRLLAA